MFKVMITQIVKGKVVGKTVLTTDFNNIADALHAADEYSRVYDHQVYQIREYDDGKSNVISFDNSDSGRIVYVNSEEVAGSVLMNNSYRMGDYLTYVSKPPYPFNMKIEELRQNVVKVLTYDGDSCSRREVLLGEVRLLTAQEVLKDVCVFYDITEPSFTNFNKEAQKYLECEANELISQANELRESVDDIEELSSNELWEVDRCEEVAGWYKEIIEMIDHEK